LARLPQVILTVSDLSAAAAFYRDRLGFGLQRYDARAGLAEVTGPGSTPLILATAEADLGDLTQVPRAARGAVVYLQRPDLPELAQRLRQKGLTFQGPEEPYPGFRHLLVRDPDGYLVTFWEPVSLPDDEILRIYQEGPARLRAAVEGLPDDLLDQPWAPGKWTLRQLVHHITDADLGTFEVLRIALALPGKQIQTNTWNPDDWMAGLQCHRRPVEPALALLEAARAWVLDAVAHLPDALDRTVCWPSGYRASVRDLLRQVGGHALHHILQIETALGRFRAEGCGSGQQGM